MLTGDSVPEEAREEVVRRSQAGEKVTVAAAKAVIEEHRPAVQPKPLTQEQLDEFFAWYWSGTNPQAVANNPSPLASLRSIIERSAIGSTNRVWRYEIRNGYIRVWHVQNGNMFDRGPDEAWLCTTSPACRRSIYQNRQSTQPRRRWWWTLSTRDTPTATTSGR